MDVIDQCRPIYGLGKVADSSSTQDARPDGVFRERGDENDWQAATLAAQCVLQLHTVHVRHLNVGNHAGRGIDVRRAEELGGGRKGVSNISMRSHKPAYGVPHGRIIVDDRNRWR
jgi:hypothetical protein